MSAQRTKIAVALLSTLALGPSLASCRHATTGGDAGPGVDGGGTPVDTGHVMGGGNCGTNYAGCTTIDDHLGQIITTVGIDNSGPTPQYFPRCIRISVGSFLQVQASPADPVIGAGCSPIDSPLPHPSMPATMNGQYQMMFAGNYGLYSATHGSNDGSGMAALVIVE